MIFNGKGKLFGRFNIADIAMVIIVLFILVGLIYKFNSDNPNSPLKSSDNIRTTFYVESLSDSYPIENGDVVKDRNTNAVFGTVCDVKLEDSIDYGFNSEGMSTVSSKPYYNAVTITVEGIGNISDTGVFFNNTEYYLNNNLENLIVGRLPAFTAKIIKIGKM